MPSAPPTAPSAAPSAAPAPPALGLRPSRRALLGGGLATLSVGAVGWPRPAHAVGPGQRRFLFLTCFGGWDPTRALVPAFGDSGVDMERDAAPLTVGDLTFVTHPSRRWARDALSRWGAQMNLMHGILVPSVAHLACMQLVRTGALGGSPDWPAILGDASAGAEPLPHVVLSGPSYPDRLSAAVAPVGRAGQLGALISGDALEWTGAPPLPTPPAVAGAEDALVAARRSALAASTARPAVASLLAGHAEAEGRVDALLAGASGLSWAAGGPFLDQARQAARLLEAGLCRVASVAHPALWDSHSENDVYQNVLWEETIGSLGVLLDELAAMAGPAGGSLLDETVVVLMSEMGRTPRLNSDRGKDHWPYTSALVIGGGLPGGRVLGAYDPGLLGAPVGPDGAPDAGGAPLSTADLGATLLALGDVDPAEWAPGGRDLSAALG
ncbi:MAG: DUF1501 domain-containing protein [Deltaproteobacteria bacterium]|nr:DUF1501 domain-containing protein [Deltaproteobacteria bacterium]